MKKKLYVLWCSIVCVIKHLFNNNLNITLIQTINPLTRLIAVRKASITIGKLLATRSNVEIRAFDSGKVTIGDNCFFNNNCSIACSEKIVIGNNCSFGYNVVIVDHDHNIKANNGTFVSKPIVIGDDVWMGANVTILKGVKIGNNSVIAAGTIVTEDVKDNSVIIQKRITTERSR